MLAILWICPAEGSASDWVLLGGFDSGWQKAWKERVLADHANRYRVVMEGRNPVLRLISHGSASGFWREHKIQPVTSGKIAWSWKVAQSLAGIANQRVKKGDDYAARVFVVFEPGFLNWRTRSICYVWAGHEPVGSVYENPYSDSVGTFVLENGDAKAGQWVSEERNFVADYNKYFGKNPTRVSAVAVMVDTDNTDSETSAWFRDVKIVAH